MIEWIDFKNFKALRDAHLPLGRFTLLVGPNGSGKSTALQGLMALAGQRQFSLQQIRTTGMPGSATVQVSAGWREDKFLLTRVIKWDQSYSHGASSLREDGASVPPIHRHQFERALKQVRLFSLDANAIARPVSLVPQIELAPNGAQLAGVLDRIRDLHPERFEQLNTQLTRWVPEFDRILFETPAQGQRSIGLRTREGHHAIPASELSHGTLIALALLTIAYLPEPPSIVCLEEPDHGLHPRLLRDVRDALYRLAYPQGSGEERDPVQVIATTHNPYFLDLFRDHPDEIVFVEKTGLEARFTRLSDHPDLEEILGNAPLSEVWYSGVLGGVPAAA